MDFICFSFRNGLNILCGENFYKGIFPCDEKNSQDRGVASGIYIYQIRFKDKMINKKMILVR